MLVADATSKSEQIRGEGDAERNRIFADAFSRDPDFFAFYRSMQAYETGLQHNDTRMVLKPDSEFFRYFVDPSGKQREGNRPLTAGRTAGHPEVATCGAGLRRRGRLANVRLSGRARSGLRHRGTGLRGLSGQAKRAMAHVMETPDGALRAIGIGSAVVGVLADLAGAGLTKSFRHQQIQLHWRARRAAFPP